MYYWVNQGKTYKEEKEGGYLWAPKQNKSGNSFFHWDNMLKLKPGDVVFNYRKGFVLGYCIIESEHFSASQPEEFKVDVDWQDEGYMIDAKYFLFESPLEIKTVFSKIKKYLPEKYSPLNITGEPPKIKANQGYLYESNQNIANIIFNLSNTLHDYTNKEEHEEKPTYNTQDLTTKRGLVTSRVGQGEYRQRILRRWNYKCAVNGSSIKEILIASHIVPWRDSNNQERLDVENGLLLSPTYDALFDRHLISFNSDGEIISSKSLSLDDFKKLGITGNEKISNLSTGNKVYLERHRQRLVKLK